MYQKKSRLITQPALLPHSPRREFFTPFAEIGVRVIRLVIHCAWMPRGRPGMDCRCSIQSTSSFFFFLLVCLLCSSRWEICWLGKKKKNETFPLHRTLKNFCALVLRRIAQKRQSAWIIDNTKNVSVIIQILQWEFGARLKKKNT